VSAVNSGSLLILVGAAAGEDLEVARPVLEQLGDVHYVGDLDRTQAGAGPTHPARAAGLVTAS